MAKAHPTATMIKWGFATIARPILACAKLTLASLPLVPAIAVNVDWSGKVSFAWSLASVGGIVMAAVFFEAARHVRWRWAIALMCTAVFLMYSNMLVAIKTASVASEGDRNARETRILAANSVSSQSSQSSQRRTALVAIAGETPSATYEAQIQEAISRGGKKWEWTTHCTADVTTKALETYCAEIASLEGKKSAALEREKLDAQPAPIAVVPPSEDPFADSLAELAAAFGIQVNKEALTAHLNGVRALALEITAALGPMAVLCLFEREQLRKPNQEPKPIEPTAPEPEGDTAPPQIKRDEQERQRLHDIFVADSLETHNGTNMRTSEPWKLWNAFCAARSVDPGDQRSFTRRLRKNFAYDPNNNRPRFLNVRAKPKTPALRLAVSNARSA